MTVDTLGIDPNVRLIRGRAIFSAGLIPGLDETFDAMIILGMHAMEGTRDGVMNSTFVGNMRAWINGKEVGETGLFSAVAAQMGIPTILVSGDEAVARESRDLIPDIYTVAVKKGLSRYSAEIVQPEKAWAMITETTRESIKNYKKVSLFNPTPPVELRVEYSGNTQLVDCVAQVPGVVRINGTTLSYSSATVSEGLRAMTHLASWMLGDHPII
jgi:D-amino peptidase